MHKNEFDDRLRQILNSQEFAYDPANWAQAEKLLQKQKKRLGFGWWTGLLLAVGFFMVNAVSYKTKLSAELSTQIKHTTPSVTISTTPQTMPEQANTLPKTGFTSKNQQQQLTAQTTKSAPLSQPALPITSEKEAASAINIDFIGSLSPRFALLHNLQADLALHAEKSIAFERQPQTSKFQQQLGIGLYNWWGQKSVAKEIGQAHPLQTGLGFLIDYRFHNRLGLRVSPGLVYHANIGLQASRSDTSYSFGQQLVNQNARVSSLLLFQLPLELYLQLAPRHQVGVGVQGSWQIGASYSLETQSTSTAGPSQTNENTEWVRISNLNNWPVTKQLFYRFKLNEAIQIGLNYQLPQLQVTVEEARWRFYLAYNFYQRGL